MTRKQKNDSTGTDIKFDRHTCKSKSKNATNMKSGSIIVFSQT